MFLHGTSRQNESGHLEIGGVDVLSLAEKYGTPLYVYDVALIRERARNFQKAFREADLKAQVAYASKAFSSIAMIQLAEEEGLSLDVVSGGELFTAIKAGFPPERIHFHGNNKSPEELQMALEHKIGCIVLDNFHEISITEELCKRAGQTVDVLLRITPELRRTHTTTLRQARRIQNLDLTCTTDRSNRRLSGCLSRRCFICLAYTATSVRKSLIRQVLFLRPIKFLKSLRSGESPIPIRQRC